jgi:hypothetical protein
MARQDQAGRARSIGDLVDGAPLRGFEGGPGLVQHGGASHDRIQELAAARQAASAP